MPERSLAARDGGLVDLLDRLLGVGVVAAGDVTLSVAGIDLVYVNLRALLASVEAAWPGQPAPSGVMRTAADTATAAAGDAVVGPPLPVRGDGRARRATEDRLGFDAGLAVLERFAGGTFLRAARPQSGPGPWTAASGRRTGRAVRGRPRRAG